MKSLDARFSKWLDDSAGSVLLMPAILIVLFLSIFPLIVSLYLSFTRIQFVKGGFGITWLGLSNYNKLLFGGEQRHFLGRFVDLSQMSIIGWIVLLAWIGLMGFMYVQYVRRLRLAPFGLIWHIGVVAACTVAAYILAGSLTEDRLPANVAGMFIFFGPILVFALISIVLHIFGAAMRIFAVVFSTALVFLMVNTLSEGGIPGTLAVTLIFVFVGVAFQYLIGLGLALLVTQNLRGKRFFRVVFLLPMMITPVGIGFLFRMLADTNKGPIVPIWVMLGLQNFSWADTPAGARAAIMVGDIWQWTPFMFIILLAALEATSTEQVEAAMVDGATRSSLFRYIILPQILPVSLTLIMIRMIEAFKIVDLPVILTGGGPGTATESLTLYAYNLWRAIDLGSSAAIAYMLLIVVTFIATMYVRSVRRRLVENL